jgi:hypothetical protein
MFKVGDIVKYVYYQNTEFNNKYQHYGIVTNIERDPNNIKVFYDVNWFDGSSGTAYYERDLEIAVS